MQVRQKLITNSPSADLTIQGTQSEGVYISATGDFGGGTIEMQKLELDRVTWSPLLDGNDIVISFTSAFDRNLKLPKDLTIRANLTGATSPDINLSLVDYN